MNIIHLEKTDLDEIARIEAKVASFPWTFENFEKALALHKTCWGLKIENEIVGYIIFSGNGHIHNLGVKPSYQRKGLAKYLLKNCFETLISKNISSVFLEVGALNEKALKLYEKLGFEQIDIREDYYRDADRVEDAIILGKYLL